MPGVFYAGSREGGNSNLPFISWSPSPCPPQAQSLPTRAPAEPRISLARGHCAIPASAREQGIPPSRETPPPLPTPLANNPFSAVPAMASLPKLSPSPTKSYWHTRESTSGSLFKPTAGRSLFRGSMPPSDRAPRSSRPTYASLAAASQGVRACSAEPTVTAGYGRRRALVPACMPGVRSPPPGCSSAFPAHSPAAFIGRGSP